MHACARQTGRQTDGHHANSATITHRAPKINWADVKSEGFCRLGPLTEHLFCITSTSAPVERVFCLEGLSLCAITGQGWARYIATDNGYFDIWTAYIDSCIAVTACCVCVYCIPLCFLNWPVLMLLWCSKFGLGLDVTNLVLFDPSLVIQHIIFYSSEGQLTNLLNIFYIFRSISVTKGLQYLKWRWRSLKVIGNKAIQ